MGAPKGNQYALGNKGGGDKPDSVKFAAFINSSLANEIGNEELKRIKATPSKKRKREDLKEVVMPIVLKGITENLDVKSGGERIGLFDFTKNGKQNRQNNSNRKDTEDDQENTGDTGRNGSE